MKLETTHGTFADLRGPSRDFPEDIHSEGEITMIIIQSIHPASGGFDEYEAGEGFEAGEGPEVSEGYALLDADEIKNLPTIHHWAIRGPRIFTRYLYRVSDLDADGEPAPGAVPVEVWTEVGPDEEA